MNENAERSSAILLRRVRICTWVFIAGIVISGLTAIPLESELSILAGMTESGWFQSLPFSEGINHWIQRVNEGVVETNRNYSFIFYGTDWLAFGHIVIALVFVGALIDPVRNIWLFQFGMISCAMVIPFALIFGHVREIPVGWRLIDCTFGIVGIIPVWLAYRWTRQLEGREEFSLNQREKPED